MKKDIMLFVLFLAVLLLCAWPLGKYMARVFNYEKPVVKDFLHLWKIFFIKWLKLTRAQKCRGRNTA